MNRVSVSTVGLCLVIFGCASSPRLLTRVGGHAIPTVASDAHPELRNFDIPAEDATVALNELSRQGNMQVLFDSVALRGRETHAVEGMLPPARALESMLKDTGLRFTPVNEKTVVVVVDSERP